MNLALLVSIIGIILYLATDAVGKYAAVGELGRIAFFAGLLAFLVK